MITRSHGARSRAAGTVSRESPLCAETLPGKRRCTYASVAAECGRLNVSNASRRAVGLASRRTTAEWPALKPTSQMVETPGRRAAAA
ncbi:hypothetical protein AB1Y20_002860 [Prymnesium parvum]|uniref:Uncharacterized protein n=1 Tax=Prymnesium parvum TaxID=97485 RepID=A0AB34JCT5_PRYPA